ncbi:relaxase/mobilization nuclease domain-containing protein (plasmid) [Streptomyces albidoflavus]|uniref:relaxase/mobilization nuclease domain-containing protein n=1 Tax=Streptomyces albidoflavus TaxID=1886 RepID=UPI002F9070EB|nr:relaxase/mobilization nuclease domain-containing protein [Streptomyces albidoflavus]WTD07617.1 relaxase/mobilization nuclease domain-containing protein [Streptomyces albidoflavus]
MQGLLYYLFGPGKANEHTDPHIVAAWGNGVPDPGRGRGNIPMLAALLDSPVEALTSRRPSKHIYHVPVRLDPQDRTLTDEQFAEIAREVMHATGVAEKGDSQGARWIAVRHAPDHIHIVATLARQDGLKVPLSQDKKKMQACARELEKRYGLRQLTSGDRTASRWPTTAEAEKAKRKGRDEPPRVTLQGKVRQAAAVAGSDDEFFTAIQSAGIRLNKRTAPDGTVTGYSVALPGDRTGAGRAVWFSGSRLAPDLSLPRVRERWNGVPAGLGATGGVGQVTSQAAAWQAAAWQVHQAAAVLGQAGNEAGAGEMVALSDFLTAYAAQAPAEVRRELREAARAFERAGRAPTSRQMHSDASRHLRTAAQLVGMSASLGVNGGEAAAAITILVAVALAIVAAQRYHHAAQHRAQEQAAARAGYHLRAATEVAYGASAGRNGRRGSRAAWRTATPHPGGPALSETYVSVVREAIPEVAERVLGEAAWPALAATLRQVENAGYGPTRVLAEVAAQRGFGDAESVAEVLVWRLQRRMDADTLTMSSSSSRQPALRTHAPRMQEAGGGRPVRWRISHSDFVNEADVTITDAAENGYLPVGASAEEFAASRLREYAASAGVNPANFAISVMEAGASSTTSLVRLPEGSVRRRAEAREEDEPPPSGARTTPPPVVGRGDSIEFMQLGGSKAPTFGEAVRQAVPAYAADVLADPASATLAAYLIKATGEGHAPADLLAEVAAARDLADAESVAQVLTWRLQGRLSGTGKPAPLPRTTSVRTGPAPGPKPGERSAADRAAQEAAQRRTQGRGPRR